MVCIKKSHPEEDPLHWKDPLPGKWREESMVRIVCFSSPGATYLEQFWISWLVAPSGQMFEALVLCAGEASKKISPGRLPYSTKLIDERLWASLHQESGSWGLTLSQTAAFFATRRGREWGSLVGESGGCVRGEPKTVNRNHEETGFCFCKKRRKPRKWNFQWSLIIKLRSTDEVAECNR